MIGLFGSKELEIAMNPSPEEIDLAQLARELALRLGSALDVNYLDGKTLLRDAVVDYLECSEAQAEELVETLELQGFARFPQLDDETHPAECGTWFIDPKS